VPWSRTADHERRIFRRRGRLVDAVCRLCGVGCAYGYALLGACWLVRNARPRFATSRAARSPSSQSAYWRSSWLFLLTRWPKIFQSASLDRSAVAVRIPGDWSGRGKRARAQHTEPQRLLAFYMVALICVSAFGTLALSFWPYRIPFVITVRRSRRAAVQPYVHVLGAASSSFH